MAKFSTSLRTSYRVDTACEKSLHRWTNFVYVATKKSTKCPACMRIRLRIWVMRDAMAVNIAHERQTGVVGEVVGKFFDNKVGHVVLTFWVNTILDLSRRFI